MRFSVHLFSFITLLLIVICPTLCLGTDDKADFKDVILTTSESHLLLFATLNDGAQEQLEDALHSGIPMQFKFLVELIHIRKNWNDKELRQMEFSHTLHYDALKEQYELELSEQHNRTITFAKLAEAMKAMKEVNGLKVIKLTQLVPDSPYELRLKAILFEKTLPMNLHHVIPFISLGDVETAWHSIEFTY